MLIKHSSKIILQNYRKSWISMRHLNKVSSLAFNCFVQDEKADKNLIIMHGLFGSKSNWTSLSKAFAKNTKHKVYAVDARNHGDSEHTEDHSYEHIAEDVKKFVEERGIEKPAVLGHSMGGRGMILFALKYPDLVEKLIVVDISPVGYIGTTQSNIPLFIQAMRAINIPSNFTIHQGRKIADEKLQEIISEKSLRDFLITNLAKSESGEFKWRINLGTLERCFQEGIAKFPNVDNLKYEGETLFVGGTKSDYLRKDDVPVIQKIFPKVQFKYLDAGHWLHAEKPEEFMKIVVDFLNK